jgi:hypothetical protein
MSFWGFCDFLWFRCDFYLLMFKLSLGSQFYLIKLEIHSSKNANIRSIDRSIKPSTKNQKIQPKKLSKKALHYIIKTPSIIQFPTYSLMHYFIHNFKFQIYSMQFTSIFYSIKKPDYISIQVGLISITRIESIFHSFDLYACSYVKFFHIKIYYFVNMNMNFLEWLDMVEKS